MPRPIRVKLEPVLGSPPGGPIGVTGVRIVFARHAEGTSNAPLEGPTAAALTFHARLLEKARTFEPPARIEVATLRGEIVLAPGGRTTFSVSTDSMAALDGSDGASPTLAVGSAPRALALHLEPPAFVGAPQRPAPRLVLPKDANDKRFHFLELDAVLEIAGSPESDLGKSDVLDVALSPRPIFGLRLVDDLGEPIETPVELTVAGHTEVIQTDGSGWVRVDSLGAANATARLADPEAVLEQLKQRWSKPRPGGRVAAAPGVTIVDPGQVRQLLLTLEERLHTVSIQPRAVQARLFGMFFDTNKSFLLPGAISSIRNIKEFYDANPQSKLLIVGHTDTSGEPSVNDPLSLERAESMAAYLRDDVDAWLGRYASSIPESRRWGRREDLAMIKSLQVQGPKFDGSDAIDRSDPVLWYQNFHNALPPEARAANFEPLEADGLLGPKTRRQLVGDYMNHDKTTLPPDIEIVAHGCGENFPVDESGFELDSNPRDRANDPVDRRVELFFFDAEFGIQPPPPGKNSGPNSREYPEWRRRSRETHDFSRSTGNLAARIPSRFSRARTFPKPSALPALREIARRMAEDPELSLVLIGHADPTGTDAANFKVSLGRAEATRAWLLGDRDFFLARFDEGDPLLHWDWEEVQWMLHSVRVAGQPCYVGEADGFPGTRTLDAIGAFQLATDDLPVNYALDRPTLERLVDQYLAAPELRRPTADRIEVLGGGSWHPPIPLGPNDTELILPDSPDLRRVEAFLFSTLPNPGVDSFPKSRAAPTVYALWCLQVQTPITIAPPPFVLQVHDPDRTAVANAVVLLSSVDPDTGELALGSVTTSEVGVAEVEVPQGVFGAQIQASGDVLSASFVVDRDESCGAALAFSRESGIEALP